MNIEYFSLIFLLLSVTLSFANIYLMLSVRRARKNESLIDRNFSLIRQELLMLSEKQDMRKVQSDEDRKRLETLERLFAALLASGNKLVPDDPQGYH